ncbi:hypothetical protein PQE71_gp104 [Bacillus phage Izhevsk]|jgi:hypothetical protein|uniref:Uncharacterized protein n=1 Tax=Bacillus phage Izhevsk TaxID=2724322 RepID=A0A6H0X665_9CAUD|nr:hypothetical protein PQE71_gp104 [Bacillus phage Izhevsk]QIW89786.1 hypothetical protein Izhevsk_105 [Bacillus phage Izhevsk]UUV46807.1 hypothetical protein [Bacillus phage vB_BanS-Thrax4]
MQIGDYKIHRKDQWDLHCKPIICIHKYYDGGNGCKRVFCLWFDGLKLKWSR